MSTCNWLVPEICTLSLIMLTLPAKLLTFKSTSTPSCGTLQLLSFSTTNLASSLLCGFVSHSVLSDALRPNGLQSTKLLCPWNSPDKNTGVGSCSLLQGIFPTQESKPCLPHCWWILYCLSHQGSSTSSLELPISSKSRNLVSLICFE